MVTDDLIDKKVPIAVDRTVKKAPVIGRTVIDHGSFGSPVTCRKDCMSRVVKPARSDAWKLGSSRREAAIAMRRLSHRGVYLMKPARAAVRKDGRPIVTDRGHGAGTTLGFHPAIDKARASNRFNGASSDAAWNIRPCVMGRCSAMMTQSWVLVWSRRDSWTKRIRRTQNRTEGIRWDEMVWEASFHESR